MYIKRIIIKKKILLKSIDLIYISLKRIQHRLGVCQKITELYVQVCSIPNVKSRAFPCIYRSHNIYLSEPNMRETCTGMKSVIGYISELRRKCAWIHISIHAGIFFKFCYTTWVFSIIQNICEKKSIHEQKDRNPHIVKQLCCNNATEIIHV